MRDFTIWTRSVAMECGWCRSARTGEPRGWNSGGSSGARSSSRLVRAVGKTHLDLVAILIDGIHLGKQVLVVALGIETSGEKHVWGLWQGAMENTTVVKELLEDLVARGLDSERRYLFVIDEAKALRAGIERVFGERAEASTRADISRVLIFKSSCTASRVWTLHESTASKCRPRKPRFPRWAST